MISAVLNENDHILPWSQGITADLFHTYGDEWLFLDHHVRKHRQTPSPGLFTSNFPEFRIAKVYDVGHYIEAVRNEHTRISMLGLVEDVMEGLKNGHNIDRLPGRVEKSIVLLRSEVQGTNNKVDIRDTEEVYEDVKARMFRARKHDGLSGIGTTWETLDNATGGFQPGEYWVIGARLGQGKTWSLVQLACSAALQGFTVQFDALEQSRTQVHMRIHNLLSSRWGRHVFQSQDLRRGNVDLRSYRAFLKEMRTNLAGHIFVDDTPRGRLTTAAIAAQIETNRPHILILDYLTLMGKTAGDWQAIAQLSADMKGLAEEAQIPIVAAAQINRTGVGTFNKQTKERQPPDAHTLAGSDAIGQDADGLVTMVSQSDRIKRFKLVKYRHGPDGKKWYCFLDLAAGTYREVSGDVAAEIREADSDEDDPDASD